MQTENISKLKIHRLSKAQYERELEAGNIDEYALYLTPDEAIDLSPYARTEEVNTIATTAANNVKNDLLNGAGAAYDTLKELGDLIDDNADAIDALEAVAAGKADSDHEHEIADVTGLQTALDGKAASSHGTHVTYSTTAPAMDGTASAGTASTVARSDHKHPIDTSRAAKTDLDSHTSDTTVHITSTERTNWNAAKTHADSAHAPSNAEKNQNAFSNVTVGSTTIAADSTTDTLTLEGSNVTITPDAADDKVTIGITKDNVTSALGYTPPIDNNTYIVNATAVMDFSNNFIENAVDTTYAEIKSAVDNGKIVVMHLSWVMDGYEEDIPEEAWLTMDYYYDDNNYQDLYFTSSRLNPIQKYDMSIYVRYDSGEWSFYFIERKQPPTYDGINAKYFNASSDDGATYTITNDNLSFKPNNYNYSFMMRPDTTSTTTTPTLNINDTGANYIRRRLSTATGTTVAGSTANWLTKNKPIRVTWDGTYWVTDLVRPSASDIYGSVPIASGGTGATSVEGALTNLGLSTETWTFTLEDGSTVTKAVYVG